MLFKNGDLTVSKILEEDKYHLAKWLSDPAVLEFYEGRDNPFDVEKVEEEFYSPEDDYVNSCIVKFKDIPIGYIQFYELDKKTRELYGYETDEVIFGIDQFIGEVDYWNKGIGTLLVSSMVNYLIAIRDAKRVVLDPQLSNKRAIKCYEKCGFKEVKLLPKHEWHEGEYRDCLLMEIKVDKN